MKRWVIFVMVMALVLSACGKKETTLPATQVVATENSEIIEVVVEEPIEEVVEVIIEEPEEVIEQEEVIDLTGLAINPLTGLYIDEDMAARRPFGVMINNVKESLPQSGIIQADVVYETLVEGGRSRLFCVFQEFDAEKIGTVRSARHYYLDFAFDLDAIYVHYGKSPQASNAFVTLNAAHLDGLSYLDVIMFYQAEDRQRPHATYTSYDGLMAGLKSEQYRTDRKEDLPNKLVFAEEEVLLEEGMSAVDIALDFSNYHDSGFIYNATTKLYQRSQYGDIHIDIEVEEQLTYDNVIIQIADMWNIAGDDKGRIDMNLVTNGTGYYITRGKVIPIKWSKEGHYDPTVYTTESGEVLEMNTGKTWIAVFPSYRPEGIIIN